MEDMEAGAQFSFKVEGGRILLIIPIDQYNEVSIILSRNNVYNAYHGGDEDNYFIDLGYEVENVDKAKRVLDENL